MPLHLPRPQVVQWRKTKSVHVPLLWRCCALLNSSCFCIRSKLHNHHITLSRSLSVITNVLFPVHRTARGVQDQLVVLHVGLLVQQHCSQELEESKLERYTLEFTRSLETKGENKALLSSPTVSSCSCFTCCFLWGLKVLCQSFQEIVWNLLNAVDSRVPGWATFGERCSIGIWGPWEFKSTCQPLQTGSCIKRQEARRQEILSWNSMHPCTLTLKIVDLLSAHAVRTGVLIQQDWGLAGYGHPCLFSKIQSIAINFAATSKQRGWIRKPSFLFFCQSCLKPKPSTFCSMSNVHNIVWLTSKLRLHTLYRIATSIECQVQVLEVFVCPVSFLKPQSLWYKMQTWMGVSFTFS